MLNEQVIALIVLTLISNGPALSMGEYQPMRAASRCVSCRQRNGKHLNHCPGRSLQAPRAQSSTMQNELEEDQQFETVSSQGEANTFTDYVPARLRGAEGTLLLPHPDPVTETSTLNSILPPQISYVLKLPKQTILQGRLTSLQLESIFYACQKHETFLPGDKAQKPARAGFFMGDGAGVGKGRQIAGIVLENFVRGRKKAVWISVSADLLHDARRDLDDIGAGAIPVHDLKSYGIGVKLSKKKELKEGVLFSTYSLLVREQGGKGGHASRLAQIVEWCGKDFDGVIAFDEAHKAKNLKFDLSEGQAGQVKVAGSKTGAAVIALQDRLLSARVVYVSATGASEPEHLGYARRLGLWGPATSFGSPAEFVSEISAGGTGAMELLAMQMKQSGQYLARSLSFKGASFEICDEPLEAAFRLKYDAAVGLWGDLRRCLKDLKMPGPAKAKLLRMFWGASLRFWDQMCMAGKVKGAVARAQAALAEGKCVVIGLQKTGEAATEAGGEDEEGCSTAERIVQAVVESWGDALPESVRAGLLARAQNVGLPVNPLDELVHELGGPGRVAEMTGRKIRQVYRRGAWAIEPRAKAAGSPDAINIQERKLFMGGKKLVAVISEAASTGVSLQADRRVRNQRRRVHITLQLPWSADKAIQQMGRTHRSNQDSAPEFKLLMTPIGGEWRFASAVASRLQQLGAITQGDRRATGGLGIGSFAIDQTYGANALRVLYDAVWSSKAPTALPDFVVSSYGGDFALFARAAKLAMEGAGLLERRSWLPSTNQFLNRLLCVPIDLQGQIFQLWQTTMDTMIRDEKLKGTYNDGIVDIASQGNTVEEDSLLHASRETGLATRYVKIASDRGVSWERAEALLAAESEARSGFYQLKELDAKYEVYNVFLVLHRKEHIATRRKLFVAMQPCIGFRPREYATSDLKKEFVKIQPAAAAELWRRCHDFSTDNCAHRTQGDYCVKGDECTVMRRFTRFHMLTGSVLASWATIKSEILERTLKIIRVQTDCGRRIVGAVIAANRIAHVKDRIIAQSARDRFSDDSEDTGSLPLPDSHSSLDQLSASGQGTSEEQDGAPRFDGVEQAAKMLDDVTDEQREQRLLDSGLWQADAAAEALFARGAAAGRDRPDRPELVRRDRVDAHAAETDRKLRHTRGHAAGASASDVTDQTEDDTEPVEFEPAATSVSQEEHSEHDSDTLAENPAPLPSKSAPRVSRRRARLPPDLSSAVSSVTDQADDNQDFVDRSASPISWASRESRTESPSDEIAFTTDCRVPLGALAAVCEGGESTERAVKASVLKHVVRNDLFDAEDWTVRVDSKLAPLVGRRQRLRLDQLLSSVVQALAVARLDQDLGGTRGRDKRAGDKVRRKASKRPREAPAPIVLKTHGMTTRSRRR